MLNADVHLSAVIQMQTAFVIHTYDALNPLPDYSLFMNFMEKVNFHDHSCCSF